MDLIIALVIVLIIVVLWRGPRTIPEIGRIFGQGVREARIEATKLRSGDDDPKDGGATAGGSAPGGSNPGSSNPGG